MGQIPSSRAEDRLKKPYQLRYQLQESNDRYALVAKATNDVIYDLDIASGIVVWNDALYSQYGYSRQEPVASVEWWTSHIHPDDAMRVEKEIGGLIESVHDTWQSEYRFRKASGDYAYVRDRAYVLRDKEGLPKRIIGAMLDVTETAKLNRAKDEFTSLVSHQLRTPLTVIQLYSAMLGEGNFGELQPEQLEHVQRINEASKRLIKLVSDILNISRIEMDRLQLNATDTDLGDFIRQRLAQLKPMATGRSIRLSLRLPKTPVVIPIDHVLLGEVLQNLVVNAVRYSPEGSTVTVTLEQQSDEYVIAIHDKGIGIPAADLPHIFERFYRASNAMDASHDGTGLGLYLAKLIVESVGGTVDCVSRPGKGTSFFMKLPLHGMIVAAD